MRYISYFFLAAFLLSRVANVHLGSHMLADGDLDHCEVCDLILQTNDGTPLQVVDTPSDDGQINELVFRPQNSYALYVAPELKFISYDYFHNLPPPARFIG